MDNMLLRKLESLSDLDQVDRDLVQELLAPARTYRRGEDVISEGAVPENVHLVASGLVCRYKLLPDGTRQIMAYLIPGDLCDPQVFVLKRMDHSIGAIAESAIIDISRQTILKLMERPKLATAMWKAVLVDEATLREWIVNVGRRPAAESLAHLFCEIFLRMRAVGLTFDGTVSIPVTQSELGETLGLSTVHVNRSLQELRARDLIDFVSGQLTIRDFPALAEFSGFEPAYLHLQ